MRLIRIEAELRSWFGGLLALALAQSLIVIVPAWMVQQLFDKFAGRLHHHYSLPTAVLVSIFVATALIAMLIEVVKRRVAAEMEMRHAANIRTKLFSHIISSPHEASRRSKGGLLLPFVGDLTAVRHWVGEGLASGASALVLIPVLLGVIATRNLVLSASLFAVLVGSFVSSMFLLRPLDAAVRDVRQRRGALTTFIAGRLEALLTIHAAGRITAEMHKVARRTDSLSAAERRRAWAVGATRGVAMLTKSVLVLCTLLVGLHESKSGRATLGTVAAILSLVHLLSAAVTDLVRAFELWRPAKVAYERIERLLYSSPIQSTAQQPISDRAGLRIEKVSVPDRITNVSGAARRGTVVWIDGPPASGKSALLGVLAGLTHIAEGRVFFNGCDLSGVSQADRARLIGYASADLPLLPGSLGMNLRYRSPRVSDATLLELARHCGLDSIIDRLGEDLKGRLTGRGDLSAGERQGIALTRALAGTPKLLLLDSIDTHLDKAVLVWLCERLRNYPGVVLMTVSTVSLQNAAIERWTLSGGRLAQVEQLDRPKSLSHPTNVLPFGRVR